MYFLRAVLIVFFLGLIPTACFKNQCKGLGGGSLYITSFSLIGFDPYYHVLDMDKYYLADEVGLSLHAELVSASIEQDVAFSLTSQVYACSPIEPILMNSLNSIYVIAVNPVIDDSVQISFGDTLNKFFNIKLGEYTYKLTDFASIPKPIGEVSYLLKPTISPNDSIVLKYEIHTRLSDGLYQVLGGNTLKLR